MSDFATAEVAVRQLHARYADAVWRKDFDAIAALYAKDAEWRFGGRVMQGPADIVAALRKIFPLFRRILMTFRTPILEVGSGIASSRTYVTEQLALADGSGRTSIGMYFERFIVTDAGWKFSWRLFQTHYSGPADMAGPFVENLDFGPPPGMPPLNAPTLDTSGVAARAWKQN